MKRVCSISFHQDLGFRVRFVLLLMTTVMNAAIIRIIIVFVVCYDYIYIYTYYIYIYML